MRNELITFILIIGVIYKLIVTAHGNFLFNMDNARDMVDVREMIVLKKLRLIGPTSAIEGFYNGPAWYYLLAIPFIVSGGDPYASIIMEIALWVIGGFFLLKLVSKWGKWLIIPIGLLWVSSNYISLLTSYAFNPNPVTFLTPVLIYLLVEFLKKGKVIVGILVWLLAGLFFNFEMNFGVFIPLIIFISILLTKNTKSFKDKYFWFGVIVFIGTLLPQLLFDLKHEFIMSKSITGFLIKSQSASFNLPERVKVISDTFLNTFQATIMNQKPLSIILLLFSIIALKRFIKAGKKDVAAFVSLIYIFVPFLGYLLLPVTVNPWHLGGTMAVSLILIGFTILNLWQVNFLGKILAFGLSIILVSYSISNILNFFLNDRGKPSMDPSLYKNEIAAIDYVYTYAKGKNFKAYTYLPSVYDYPYQYLFWWYGQKKYGYVPGEYVYSPDKPQYISNQDKFQGRTDNFSGLVFLIKEPDRIKMRQAWENDYKEMEFISKEMVGPIEVEIREEIK